jgi:hypothetical protein
MEKQQAKGELGEEELRALEMDVTGKVFAFFHSFSWLSFFSCFRLCSRRGEVPAWK